METYKTNKYAAGGMDTFRILLWTNAHNKYLLFRVEPSIF